MEKPPPSWAQKLLPNIGSRENRRKRALILPRYLQEEAGKAALWGSAQDEAHEMLKRWANLEEKGHLTGRRETAINADFLHQVFGEALGYVPQTQSPDGWQLEREFTVPGIGTSDGALGRFKPGDASKVVAVIELKDANTDLDRDRINGRTPVQQCWDYLNALPQCPWGIVSNFVTVRLYHRERTPLAFEEFHLQELREQRRFREFYYLFERGGLLEGTLKQPPRALSLLKRTAERQREVGDKLYDAYSDHRLQLISHLITEHDKPVEDAIHIAQKILDRIIFVAFCEDRGLLPDKTLRKAYDQLPPFAKVTNPRWQNFLELFRAVDKGHPDLNLQVGYNGGLFCHDPPVDDLQLADEWTRFFQSIGTYDFRDEVNVDVLGHLFERSITELERLRTTGLFAAERAAQHGYGEMPVMPKSAQRKRFGIYYTPPDFTGIIVDYALRELIEERFEELRRAHDLQEADLIVNGNGTSKSHVAYWRDCLDALRDIKVCDPSCGSGAFLIRAYDVLEEYYTMVCGHLDDDRLNDEIGGFILSENLYGVDLSPQAVEITQLALWIRSARRGKTLADLSRNIVCGNSLVDDSEVDDRAADWHELFPAVFQRPQQGFDCVIGNPPWERLKLQEREFFSFRAPNIASTVSAADRRKRIARLERDNPDMYAEYVAAKNKVDGTLSYVRACGRFPLTGKGDVNTYALFAELARSLVAPRGRVGLLVPSGIATDKTTKDFFSEIMESQSLIRFYDFENRKRVFPDVDSRFKFAVLNCGGSDSRTKAADFVFFAHSVQDLADAERHIALSNADLKLMNPNTRTCPVFRSQRDAELTKGIYRRVPVLIDRTRRRGGNPWEIRFFTMFHQTNDAELFHTAEQLRQMGFRPEGSGWRKGKRSFLPLYEAKMVQAYDHRAAGVVVQQGNWVRQGQTEATTLVSHQNPEFTVTPRWWVAREAVDKCFQDDDGRTFFVGFKDITSPTNQRTMIAAAIPYCGVTNHFPLILSTKSPCLQMCLLANLNALVLDYVARQKIGGVTLNFFIVEQFPMFPPSAYEKPCPWDRRTRLEDWLSERVLKLTCTADDIKPLAEAADFAPVVTRWDSQDRAELQAELDAAFFLLYGIGRSDAEYILGTFKGLRPKDDGTLEMFNSPDLILDAYDRLSAAS